MTVLMKIIETEIKFYSWFNIISFETKFQMMFVNM